ncbi:MAG: asparagine synthetase B, partial [Lachnospiraceae bacterium]|nr:asparagine synthetase B [Lachnospiraceae bacterium]
MGKSMCGICGMFRKNNEVDKEKFEQMIDIIAYRGPDDRGAYYENNIALGHRRLAIIDLSKEGHQPFSYKDRYIMVYNGEIYNFRELREQLRHKGYEFATKTDTEVLIAMYDCYGKECVKHLNGMWAFAVYDRQQQTIFCSRDRFGVKPFYYCQS